MQRVASASDAAGSSRTSDSHTPARQRGRPYPALFVCHGGGPLPLLGEPSHAPMVAAWRRHWEDVTARHGRPAAVVVVVPRWPPGGGGGPVVSAHFHPPLSFDYTGDTCGPADSAASSSSSSPSAAAAGGRRVFPAAAYECGFRPRGAPALALRVVAALRSGGFPGAACAADMALPPEAFIPLGAMMAGGGGEAAAAVPVVALSLPAVRGARRHEQLRQCLAVGAVLAPLRDDGVFVVGSGATVYAPECLGGTGAQLAAASAAFNDSLSIVLQDPPAAAAGASSSSSPASPPPSNVVSLLLSATAARDRSADASDSTTSHNKSTGSSAGLSSDVTAPATALPPAPPAPASAASSASADPRDHAANTSARIPNSTGGGNGGGGGSCIGVVRTPEERLLFLQRLDYFRHYGEVHNPRTAARLLPLLVCAGAARGRPAREVARVPFLRADARHYLFED